MFVYRDFYARCQRAAPLNGAISKPGMCGGVSGEMKSLDLLSSCLNLPSVESRSAVHALRALDRQMWPEAS